MKPTQDNIVNASKMVKRFSIENLIQFSEDTENLYALIAGGLYIRSMPNKKGVPPEDVDECIGIILNWAELPEKNLIFRQFYNMLRAIKSPIGSGIIPPPPPPPKDDD